VIRLVLCDEFDACAALEKALIFNPIAIATASIPVLFQPLQTNGISGRSGTSVAFVDGKRIPGRSK
jgi:hypothetical protein